MSDFAINNINLNYKLPISQKHGEKVNQRTSSEYTPENLPVETYKAYALAKPSFKSSNLSFNNIDLLLTDEVVEPRIRVEIVNNNDFKTKIGVSSVYEFAAHDQLHDLLKRNPNLKEEDSFVRTDMRRFDVSCSENNLLDTLKLINDNFVNLKIKKRYINQAQNLTKIDYQLHIAGAETVSNYDTIPKNITPKDFDTLIDDISTNDVEKYCNDILENSDVKIVLQANRKFYNEHKSEILTTLSNIIGK